MMVLVQDNVRSQDSIYGIFGCSSSRVGRAVVWEFLQKHWGDIVQRFGEKSSLIIYVVEVIYRLNSSTLAWKTIMMKYFLVCFG